MASDVEEGAHRVLVNVHLLAWLPGLASFLGSEVTALFFPIPQQGARGMLATQKLALVPWVAHWPRDQPDQVQPPSWISTGDQSRCPSFHKLELENL